MNYLKKTKDLDKRDNRHNIWIKFFKKPFTIKPFYPLIISKHLFLILLFSFSIFSFRGPLYAESSYHSPIQNKPVASPIGTDTEELLPEQKSLLRQQLQESLIETDTEGFLPPPFYSVTKDGKTHWVFGYLHPIPSFSHFVCYRQIEQKIKESDLVFLERSQDSIRRVLLHSSVQQSWAEQRNHFPALGSFNELNEQTRDFFINEDDFLLRRYLSTFDSYSSLDYRDYLLIAFFIERFKIFKMFLDYKLDKLIDSLGVTKISLDDENNIDLNLLYMRDIYRFMEWSIKNQSSEGISQIIESTVNNIISLDTDLEEHELNIYPYQKYRSAIQKIVSKDILNHFNEEQIQIVLVDRNKIWLDKFLTAHRDPKNNSLFLAGGLGHLIGPFNLLDMLREEGFTVQLMDCGFKDLLFDERVSFCSSKAEITQQGVCFKDLLLDERASFR